MSSVGSSHYPWGLHQSALVGPSLSDSNSVSGHQAPCHTISVACDRSTYALLVQTSDQPVSAAASTNQCSSTYFSTTAHSRMLLYHLDSSQHTSAAQGSLNDPFGQPYGHTHTVLSGSAPTSQYWSDGPSSSAYLLPAQLLSGRVNSLCYESTGTGQFEPATQFVPGSIDPIWQMLEAERPDLIGSGLINPQHIFSQPDSLHSRLSSISSEELSFTSSPDSTGPSSLPQGQAALTSPRLWQEPAFFRLRRLSQQADLGIQCQHRSPACGPKPLDRDTASIPHGMDDDGLSQASDWSRDAEGSPDFEYPGVSQAQGRFEECGSDGGCHGGQATTRIRSAARSARSELTQDLAADNVETAAFPGGQASCSASGAMPTDAEALRDTASGRDDTSARQASHKKRRAAAKGRKVKRKVISKRSRKRGLVGFPKNGSSAGAHVAMADSRDCARRVVHGDALPRLRQVYLTRQRQSEILRQEAQDNEDETAATILANLSRNSDDASLKSGDASSEALYSAHGAEDARRGTDALQLQDGQFAEGQVVGRVRPASSYRRARASSRDREGLQRAELSAELEAESSSFASGGEDSTARATVASKGIRQFPPGFPIHERFPRFYQRYKVPSSLPEGAKEEILADADHDQELCDVAARADIKFEASYNVPKSLLDLYTPRFCKGVGMGKEGLCPICYEEGIVKFCKTKISAYNYHLQYAHGISASTGLPFTPPTAFQICERPRAAAREKAEILQGKCHVCKKYIDIEGTKVGTVKVPEIYWWKHAQVCHRSASPPAGMEGVFVEDAFYTRVKAWMERQPIDADTD